MGEEEATVEAGWHSKGDLCVGGLPGKYAWDGFIDEVRQRYTVDVDEAALNAVDLQQARQAAMEAGPEGDPMMPQLERPLMPGTPEGQQRPTGARPRAPMPGLNVQKPADAGQ